MDLNRHLENISPERIVILQTDGESIAGLRNATQLIASLGSVFVEHLIPGSIWTWAFVKGGRTLFEKYFLSENVKRFQYSSSSVFVKLSNLPSYHYIDNDNLFSQQRWDFCSNYGVMGDLCDESISSRTLKLKFNPSNTLDPVLKRIPVIITAGIRTSYLYQSLRSYLEATEAIKDNFFVILGTNHTQTVQLLNILNIKHKYIPSSEYGEENFFPFLYYREVFRYVNNNYQNSSYIIFLEEDIETSLDFFNYLKQTIHLLEKDQSLYCVTGFSAVGLKYLAYDEHTILRGDVQVGWGYALPMRFIEEALLSWPDTISRNSMYDAYLFKLKGKRECVLPEVSRSKHFGFGMNTNYVTTEKTFLNMPTSRSKEIILSNVDSLELSLWNELMSKKIRDATPVTENICKENYVNSLDPGSYVMYYNFTTESYNFTYINFYLLGNCLKAWVYSFQGHHDYVLTLRLSLNTTFFLIAHPQSSFSNLKPKNYVPFDIYSLSKEDLQVYSTGSIIADSLSYMYYKESTLENIKNLFKL